MLWLHKLGEYRQWALYGAVLVISCALLGIYCAWMFVWQCVNCCLSPCKAVWWIVSTAIGVVTSGVLFLLRLILPI